MPSRAVLLLAVVATLPLDAQTEKKPWQYTVEERIALRTDPALARERVRAKARSAQQHSIREDERATLVDDIDGKKHPELFLPHEVFDQFIFMIFTSDQRTGMLRRRGFNAEVKRHGLPDDFWLRLESLAAPFISDWNAILDLGPAARRLSGSGRVRADADLNLKYEDLCRSRIAALTAARKEFGRETFDRFLYEVIARGMFSVTDKLPDSAFLRRREEGCR